MIRRILDLAVGKNQPETKPENASTTAAKAEGTPASIGPDLEQPRKSRSPHGWSGLRKLYFGFGIVLSSFTPTFSNSAYVASVPGVQLRFNVTVTVALLGISLYSIGFAVGPALASAATELFGRAWILKGSLLLCFIFTIVSATATTFRTMIVARAFAGITGSASVTPLGAVINDLFDENDEEKRDSLLALYAVAFTWATNLGPAVGESVVRDHDGDWRWSFWLTTILLGICFLWMLPLPETYHAEIRQQKLMALSGREKLVALLKIGLGRPIHMALVEGIVFPCSLLVAVTQVVLFVLYVAIPLQLETVYRFNTYHVGLSFLAIFVGSVIGLVILKLCEVKLARPRAGSCVVAGGLVHPRERLFSGMIGCILQPVGLFWFAWTCRPHHHWIVPLLGIMVWGIAFVLIQLGFPIYKNAIYSVQYGASVLAVDLILRYLLSSFFPLFTINMINAMTFEWTISLFAFVSILLAPIPFILYWYGGGMLERSRYLNQPVEPERPASGTVSSVGRVPDFERLTLPFG